MGRYDVHESVRRLGYRAVIQITVGVLNYALLSIFLGYRLLAFVNQVLRNHADAVEIAGRITDQVLKL